MRFELGITGCPLDKQTCYPLSHTSWLYLLNSKLKNAFPPDNNLIKLLEMVIRNHYLQINGNAMGMMVFPTYANLFMDSIERIYIFTYSRRPSIWYRLIDDISGIFSWLEVEQQEFIEYCNTFHASIKFTLEHLRKLFSFLDVITYKNNNRIKSTLHVKPTDTHSYLDYRSCHSQSTKSSIPFSQFLRITWNCTDWTKFLHHSIMLSFLFKRISTPFGIRSLT